MAEYFENQHAPVRAVRHAELERVSASAFRSRCPVCKEGLLLVYRDSETMKLSRWDVCTRCAQGFEYVDEAINGEALS